MEHRFTKRLIKKTEIVKIEVSLVRKIKTRVEYEKTNTEEQTGFKTDRLC